MRKINTLAGGVKYYSHCRVVSVKTIVWNLSTVKWDSNCILIWIFLKIVHLFYFHENSHGFKLFDDKFYRFFNKYYMQLNPQAPVALKVADEVVFLRFQGERVEFF